jgi:hypothetical protein
MATNPYPGVTIGGGGGAGSGPITITGAGAGHSGHVYVSNGTGANWASTSATTTAKGQLKLEGNDADIFVQGKSMKAWMETVERRLSILVPNPELQEKYEALQNAYDTYKTLESLLYEQE